MLFTEVNSKLGSPFLSILHGHPNVELAAVVTSPPGKLCSYFTDDEEAVDVADQARALGVRVLRPRSVNDPDAVEALAALDADHFLVGNFQQLLGAPLLDLPRRAAVNFHPHRCPSSPGSRRSTGWSARGPRPARCPPSRWAASSTTATC